MKPRVRASALSKQDWALIEAAGAAITARHGSDWQEVGAAMRTRDGRILTGVNLDAYLGRMAVCAEAVALGRAITDIGETGIDTIVAVLSPCGSCRELIWDYERNARVIVPGEKGPTIASISELLPNKYRRER